MSFATVVDVSSGQISTRPYTPEPPEPITMADIENALQRLVDSTAQQRGYRNGDACASYASSTVQQWKDEALAFISWRDSVWLAAFAFSPEDDIESVQQVVSTMPAMVWPED